MIYKLFKYRLLILQILYLLCKYMLIRTFLSSKELIIYVSRQDSDDIEYYTSASPVQPFSTLINSLNRVLNLVYSNGNCLVKCLVKRDLLKKYGFSEDIILGIKGSEQGIKAHAWLPGERNFNYNIVHLL